MPHNCHMGVPMILIGSKRYASGHRGKPYAARQRRPSGGGFASNGSKGLRQVPARKGVFGCVRSLTLGRQKSSFVNMIDQKAAASN